MVPNSKQFHKTILLLQPSCLADLHAIFIPARYPLYNFAKMRV
nr:MAG TPA: hypothetical protein [Caudoviricetes sp.]